MALSRERGVQGKELLGFGLSSELRALSKKATPKGGFLANFLLLFVLLSEA
jgi:hypothetical protein